MSIFICEDDVQQRDQLAKIVRNYVMIEELDMKLVLVASEPQAVLDYLLVHPGTLGIYLLDIDLKSHLNGIELAAQIREHDALGKIIFVTTHAELVPVTFRYKVEAYDYIIKSGYEQLQAQIIDSLHSIENRKEVSAPAMEQFLFKSGTKTRAVNFQDILFFETLPTPHKIALHSSRAHYQFYGRLKEINQQVPQLVRVHKSILANLMNVVAVDSTMNQLEFSTGKTCPVAVSKMRQIEKMWRKLQVDD